MTSVEKPDSCIQPVAAVCTDSGALADHAVDAFIDRLQAQGGRIVGLRQRLMGECGTGCAVQLQSIGTGEYHRMTQQLGSGSVSCNVDAEAIELLAVSLMAELHKGVDLVVVNRFGKRESEGAGFCCVIELAIELGIPVLTVVRKSWKDAWLEYGGDWVTTLTAESSDILNWYERAIDSSNSTMQTIALV